MPEIPNPAAQDAVTASRSLPTSEGFMAVAGYSREGKTGLEAGIHGTTYDKANGRFFYEKDCHKFDSLEKANNGLAVMQGITEKGFFHPATTWDIVKKGDTFQLLGISPAIQGTPNAPVELVKMFDEGSPQLELMRRLDPSVSKTEGPAPDSLVQLLNFSEMSKGGNIMQDTESGTWFAVDVEAVDLTGERAAYIAASYVATSTNSAQ